MTSDNSMPLTTATAGIYTDFDGLSRLKGQASEQTPEAKKEVAQQFEALFIQIMLKSMRDASQLSESTDGDQTRFYQDMYDKQIALDLASGSGIGLAAVIERQLGGDVDAKPSSAKLFSDLVEQHWKPDNQQAFIKDLWPFASKAAEELGVEPEVLIAQSALETGWGQKVITDEHGLSSLNLFGIKADGRWQGDHATVTTLEFREGVAQQERASFRSYPSRADSMSDYVDFIKNGSRYASALANASGAGSYLNALQQAGYATDPAYAQKISGIMSDDAFVQTVADLKTTAGFRQTGFSL